MHHRLDAEVVDGGVQVDIPFIVLFIGTATCGDIDTGPFAPHRGSVLHTTLEFVALSKKRV